MADEEKSEGKKKKGWLKWVILLVLLLLLAGGGYFAYMKFFASSGPEATPAVEAEEQVETPANAPSAPGETTVVTLPTFLVNLADPLGRRYIKLTLDVEVAGEDAAEELEASMPKVRDTIILLLSSKSYTDLSSLENKLLLKEQIVERLNLVLGGPKVLRVYFTELVIQ